MKIYVVTCETFHWGEAYTTTIEAAFTTEAAALKCMNERGGGLRETWDYIEVELDPAGV